MEVGKRFGDKFYEFAGLYHTERKAKNKAKSLRKRGYLARVTKEKPIYYKRPTSLNYLVWKYKEGVTL